MAPTRFDGSRDLLSPTSGDLSALFDYYAILDFEATCLENRQIRPQEIIEWSVVLLCGRTLETKAEFQQFIRPIHHPFLSKFCIELTGITQDKVDRAEEFEPVFNSFTRWLEEDACVCTLSSQQSQASRCTVAFVTCGDWDLRTMLPANWILSGLQRTHSYPGYYQRWINAKTLLKRAIGLPRPLTSLSHMLQYFGLQFHGRPHSAIDDCRNIAHVLRALRQRLPELFPFDFTWTDHRSPAGNVLSPSSATSFHSSISHHSHCTRRLAAIKPRVIRSIFPEATQTHPSTHYQRNLWKPNITPANLSRKHEEFTRLPSSLQTRLVNNTQRPSSNARGDFRRRVALSKSLSWVLRHGAPELNLQMDSTGFVCIRNLLQLTQKGTSLPESQVSTLNDSNTGLIYSDDQAQTFTTLQRAQKRRRRNNPLPSWTNLWLILQLVQEDPKGRFEVISTLENEAERTTKQPEESQLESILWIRATQGHSIYGIHAGLTKITSASEVPLAVHGTSLFAWQTIRSTGGLSRMQRRHIHFATSLPNNKEGESRAQNNSPTGQISGMRPHAEVFLFLDVEMLLGELELFKSRNGVILCSGDESGSIPLRFISSVQTSNGENLLNDRT